MDVTGSYMASDVFVAATPESTESVTFVEEKGKFSTGSYD